MGCSSGVQTNNEKPQSTDKPDQLVPIVKPTELVEVKEVQDDPPMVKLLKGNPPDFKSLTDIADILALWLLWHERLLLLVKNMNRFEADFLTQVKFFHAIVSKMLSNKDSNFDDNLKDALVVYITAIWSQNHEEFVSAYNAFDDLIGFNGLEKAKNLQELHDIFLSVQDGIVSDLENTSSWDTPMEVPLSEFKELHRLILEHLLFVISSNYSEEQKTKQFDKIKKCLTEYKTSTNSYLKVNTIQVFKRIKILFGLFVIANEQSLLNIKAQFENDEKNIINQFTMTNNPKRILILLNTCIVFTFK